MKIDIPDNTDIKTALASLRENLKLIELQRNVILGAIKQLQRQCPHKNARYDRDFDGGPAGQCLDCGYSW